MYGAEVFTMSPNMFCISYLKNQNNLVGYIWKNQTKTFKIFSLKKHHHFKELSFSQIYVNKEHRELLYLPDWEIENVGIITSLHSFNSVKQNYIKAINA